MKRKPFSMAYERSPAIVRAFASLSALGFQVAQPQPKAEAKRPHPRHHDLAIRLEEHATLREMAARAVWQEVGGKAIREPSKYHTGGKVVGRTVWVGMPEWARGLGMNRAAIENAVDKAIAGERLGRRQALCLRIMLAEIRGEDLSAAPAEVADCPF